MELMQGFPVQVFRSFKRTIAVLLGLFTLFWLPSDIQQSSEAAKPWQRALAVFDQTTALWLAALAMGAWIVWTDLRPFIRRWRAKPRVLEVADRLFVESAQVESERGTLNENLFCNRVYLQVRNTRPDKMTLRRVAAQVFLFGPPRPLRTRDGESEIDLRHGEFAYFEVGRCLSHHRVGMPVFHKNFRAKAKEIGDCIGNLKNEHMMFELAPDSQDPIKIGYPKELPPVGRHFRPLAALVADDIEAVFASLEIDPRKLPDDDAAFIIHNDAEAEK